MSRIEKAFDILQKLMKFTGAACLVGMMLLTCVDVIGRYFNRPIFGSVELVGFMATLAVALALPYTHQVRGHIGVEIFVRFLPQKGQVLMDLFTNVFALCLVSIVTWQMAVYARTMQVSGEVSMSLEFPEHVIIYLVALCFLMFSLAVLLDIIRLCGRVFGRE